MDTTELAKYDEVMVGYWRAQARHEYWFGLANALKQWARHEEDRSLSRLGRIFYTGKVLLCMLLRRHKSYWLKDYITVAIFDNEQIGSCGGAYVPWYSSWNQLVVGGGIRKGWWYDIYPDST